MRGVFALVGTVCFIAVLLRANIVWNCLKFYFWFSNFHCMRGQFLPWMQVKSRINLNFHVVFSVSIGFLNIEQDSTSLYL